MRVFVIGDGLEDIAFQAVHGQVHLGQANGGGVLLQPPDEQFFRRAAAMLFDGPGTLHEHTAGTAGRVEDDSVIRVDHMGNQGDNGNGSEELAAVMGLLVGELGQKVFIDAAEDIAGNLLQLLRVEGPKQLAEDIVVQLLVFGLGEDAAQVLVILLDGLHRLDQRLGPIGTVRQRHQRIKLCFGPQKDGALFGKVLLGQRPGFPTPAGQGRLDLHFNQKIPAIGMTQKHQPHDRQEVLIAGIVGIGPQSIRSVPQPLFNCLDMFKLSQSYPQLRRLFNDTYRGFSVRCRESRSSSFHPYPPLSRNNRRGSHQGFDHSGGSIGEGFYELSIYCLHHRPAGGQVFAVRLFDSALGQLRDARFQIAHGFFVEFLQGALPGWRFVLSFNAIAQKTNYARRGMLIISGQLSNFTMVYQTDDIVQS